MKIFICGFTGAGKTTLLKCIEREADLINYKFIDLDQCIAQNLGISCVSEIINERGIEYFRELEYLTIKELSKTQNLVLALGGGGLSESTEPLLAGWSGFWLNTDFETCWKRVEKSHNRPLVKLGKEGLRRLYQERSEFYQKYPAINSFEDVSRYLKLVR